MKANKKDTSSKQLPDVVMKFIPVRHTANATAKPDPKMTYEAKEIRQVSRVFINPQGELETDTSVVKQSVSSAEPTPKMEMYRKHSVVPVIRNEAKRRVRSNVSYRVRKTQSAKVPMVTLDKFLAKPKSLQQPSRVNVQKRSLQVAPVAAPQPKQSERSKFRDVVVNLSKKNEKKSRRSSRKSIKRSLKRMIRKSLKKSLRKSLKKSQRKVPLRF